jgi:hypothetical protein
MREEVEKQIMNINLPDMDDDFFLPNDEDFMEMLYKVEALLDGDNKGGVELTTIVDKMMELYRDGDK